MDRTKAAASYKKHGVCFMHVVRAFENPFALDPRNQPRDRNVTRLVPRGERTGKVIADLVPRALEGGRSSGINSSRYTSSA